jgi:cathepsin L
VIEPSERGAKGNTQGTSATTDFGNFVNKYSKAYEPGSDEYKQREALFQQRAAEVKSQNSRPGRLWTAKVNKFADHTEEELAKLRGYRRTSSEHGVARQTALLGTESRAVSIEQLPVNFDWKHLNAMKNVQDQGACGSCWAFASSLTVRAHGELYHTERSCSVQELLACTQNPNQCGGKGGCEGATVELGMERIFNNGCMTNKDWPYAGRDQQCSAGSPKTGLKSFLPSFLGLDHSTPRAKMLARDFGMLGYTKLPENRVEPLLLAVYERGPVAISLAAGYNWNFYTNGILDACPKEAVIDHAVVLVGFGEDPTSKVKYWTIMNSWGPDWGEHGFIRLMRHGNQEENEYCGWDEHPEMGNGCKDGPKKVWVCGSCGILYDNVVPNFEVSPDRLTNRSHQSV